MTPSKNVTADKRTFALSSTNVALLVVLAVFLLAASTSSSPVPTATNRLYFTTFRDGGLLLQPRFRQYGSGEGEQKRPMGFDMSAAAPALTPLSSAIAPAESKRDPEKKYDRNCFFSPVQCMLSFNNNGVADEADLWNRG